MTSAGPGDPPGGPGMARGYHGGEPVPSFDLATVGLGAGDIWCTAANLLRWDDAVSGRGGFGAPYRWKGRRISQTWAIVRAAAGPK
jgi:hypothetical protein